MKSLKMFIGLFLVLALCFFIAPNSVGAAQGDEVWTETGRVGWTGNDVMDCDMGNDGSGASVLGVAFPYDNNAQVVIHYIDATGWAVGNDLDWYGYISETTGYTTLTKAWNGATTSYVHVNDAFMVQVLGGVSYVVVDNGAGIAGWGELLQGTGAGFDYFTTFQITAGASNFGVGPFCSRGIDLTGVTFPVGSRVYPMFRIGTTLVGAGNVQYDNYPGLIAARTNGPLLGVLQGSAHVASSSPGSGITINAVTAQYH